MTVGRRALTVAVAGAALLTGCTHSAPTDQTNTASTTSTSLSGSSVGGPTAGPAGLDGALIRAAVESFNATAGGAIADQQRLLKMLVAPGQQAAQQACPTARTTLRLEPVYGDLAPAPDWRPSRGSFAGQVYSLPTLIRIYSGGRLIGTDLADLHLAIENSQARFPTLCVS